MIGDPTIRSMQKAIIANATEKLGRPLTERETVFITSRTGFIALEMIADTVKASSAEYVAQYLNSD